MTMPPVPKNEVLDEVPPENQVDAWREANAKNLKKETKNKPTFWDRAKTALKWTAGIAIAAGLAYLAYRYFQSPTPMFDKYVKEYKEGAKILKEQAKAPSSLMPRVADMPVTPSPTEAPKPAAPDSVTGGKVQYEPPPEAMPPEPEAPGAR